MTFLNSWNRDFAKQSACFRQRVHTFYTSTTEKFTTAKCYWIRSSAARAFLMKLFGHMTTALVPRGGGQRSTTTFSGTQPTQTITCFVLKRWTGFLTWLPD